jgi:hypothetical protein
MITGMSSIIISGIMVVLAASGMLLGMFLHSRLPEHHLSPDVKDISKVALGLVATISALVLSLLLSTAKTAYDLRRDELVQLSTDILLLDRVLAYYGPGASDIQLQLREAVVDAIERFWPSDGTTVTGFNANASQLEGLHEAINRLPPDTEGHQALRAQALPLQTEINRTCFLLISHAGHSIPIPFLIVLILWVTVIFTGLGLFAPVNPTAIIIFLVCALSAAGAIFLILELDEPFVGGIKASDAPLQLVLTRLGR